LKDELKSRIILGLFGATLITLAIFVSKITFLILIIAIFVLASIEIIKLLGLNNKEIVLFTLTAALTCILMIYFFPEGRLIRFNLVIIPALIWILSILLIIFLPVDNKKLTSPFYALYLWIPFIFLFFIRRDFDAIRIFILFLTVWSLDSFSYLFGKIFGQKKIAPTISPNKTLEGTLFGLVLSFAIFVLLRNYLIGFAYKTLILGFLLPISGFLGDLFESFLKRRENLKDSGSLLQAHGGILDRFDSLFFTTIAFYLFLLI